MTAPKRKISVSVDAHLVEELERGSEGLSTQVNEAIREAVSRRRRQRLLRELLADLEAEHGPLSQKLLEKYETILE